MLTLKSDHIVQPGHEVCVDAALPHDLIALLPDCATFDDPDAWLIIDVVVGSRSLRTPGGLLGQPVVASEFAAAVADGRISFQTVQTRMTVMMRVTPQRDGLRFRCVLSGRACVYTPWRQYRRSKIAELRSYVPGEDLDGVSIAAVDRQAGSPREGDMIARNPKNHADQWLVAAAYFADNFEPLE